MKKIGKKKEGKDGKNHQEEDVESSDDDENEKLTLANKDDSDIYYYHKVDKTFKVFNSKEKSWSAQDNKPSDE